jgi:hypothetical protein
MQQVTRGGNKSRLFHKTTQEAHLSQKQVCRSSSTWERIDFDSVFMGLLGEWH